MTRFFLPAGAVLWATIQAATGEALASTSVWLPPVVSLVSFVPFPSWTVSFLEIANRGIVRSFPVLLVVAALSLTSWYGVLWHSSGNFTPVVHDEFAYLFQAKTFLAGKVAFPAPPDPLQFDAFHVLTKPVFASKYPPGHALLLVPGTALGAPWISILGATFLSFLLLGILARPIAGATGALLLVIFFGLAPAEIQVGTTYLSQVSFLAGGLLFLWIVRRAWTGGGNLSIVGAGIVGAGLLQTRPLNAIVLAAATGIVLFGLERSNPPRFSWRRAAPLLMIPAILIIACGFAYNKSITGSFLDGPWARYSEQYHPEDNLGFYRGSTPVLTEAGPGKRMWIDNIFYPNWKLYTPSLAVKTLFSFRIPATVEESMPVILLIFLLPALALRGQSRRWTIACLLLFTLSNVAYFFYWSTWIRYYHEIATVILLAPILGAAALARESLSTGRAGPVLAILLVLAIAFAASFERLHFQQRFRNMKSRYHSQFAEKLHADTETPAIVFVHYTRAHNPDLDLINNDPDLATAEHIFVHDFGERRNRAIHDALGGNRNPYIYLEGRSAFVGGFSR